MRASRRLRCAGPFLLQLAHALGEIGGPHAGVAQLARHAFLLGRSVGTLLLGRRERHAHLGEARHHVAPLLLEQAHVGVHATQQVLHASALLAEVAHKEALLLKQRLQLLQLALLLGGAVLRQFDRGIGLVATCGEARVVGLQQAQVVNGQNGRNLAQALGKVAMALGLVDLALERAQLAPDLALDVLGAGEVVLHRLELALGALLAAAVLGDAGRLLDQRTALLGPARQDGVELALADDGVRILAQARVVQDVGDVHEARRRIVDEVLALAGAVHATRDGDLGEIDRKGVVGVVEHERDLGEAHRLARRRTREDHVLHGLAAQLLGALLAEHPQDGVGHVGLTRPVGAHHYGEARVEHHVRAVGKGLEALERQRLQIHDEPSSGLTSPSSYPMRTSASAAAFAWDSFLVEPVPRPTRRPSTSTTEVKVGLWAGPDSPSSL